MNLVEKTLNHHLQAFGEGNVTEILADYTEDSVLIVEDNVIKGLDNLKAFFQNLFDHSLPPGSDFTLKHTQVVDNIAYLVWTAQTDKLSFKLGTDTCVIVDGKILKHTVATSIEPRSST